MVPIRPIVKQVLARMVRAVQYPGQIRTFQGGGGLEMAKPKSPTAGVVVGRRSERGWNQEDLARQLRGYTGDPQWTRNRVKRLENNALTIDVSVLKALAPVLDVDYQTLIDGVGRRGSTAGLLRTLSDQRKRRPLPSRPPLRMARLVRDVQVVAA
jgi:transcriptional regulator with XRE-family HTH domain